MGTKIKHQKTAAHLRPRLAIKVAPTNTPGGPPPERVRWVVKHRATGVTEEAWGQTAQRAYCAALPRITPHLKPTDSTAFCDFDCEQVA